MLVSKDINNTKAKECYFNWGILQSGTQDKWKWIKAKFKDNELGEIIGVLDGITESVSFCHKYNDTIRSIWVYKKAGKVTIKVKEVIKSLTIGEQIVLSNVLTQVRQIIKKKRAIMAKNSPKQVVSPLFTSKAQFVVPEY